MYVFERSTNKYTLNTLFQTAKEGFANHVFDELDFILLEVNDQENTLHINVKEQEINITFFQKDNKVFVQLVSETAIDKEMGTKFLQVLTSLLNKDQAVNNDQRKQLQRSPSKALYIISWIILSIGIAYTLLSSFTIYKEPYMFGFYVDFSFIQLLFGSLLTLTLSSIVYALSYLLKHIEVL